MATFRGPLMHLTLQDEEGVWARSERDHAATDKARRGVVELDGKDADRFRQVAGLYGFVEDAPAVSTAKRAAKVTE